MVQPLLDHLRNKKRTFVKSLLCYQDASFSNTNIQPLPENTLFPSQLKHFKSDSTEIQIEQGIWWFTGKAVAPCALDFICETVWTQCPICSHTKLSSDPMLSCRSNLPPIIVSFTITSLLQTKKRFYHLMFSYKMLIPTFTLLSG